MSLNDDDKATLNAISKKFRLLVKERTEETDDGLYQDEIANELTYIIKGDASEVYGKDYRGTPIHEVFVLKNRATMPPINAFIGLQKAINEFDCLATQGNKLHELCGYKIENAWHRPLLGNVYDQNTKHTKNIKNIKNTKNTKNTKKLDNSIFLKKPELGEGPPHAILQVGGGSCCSSKRTEKSATCNKQAHVEFEYALSMEGRAKARFDAEVAIATSRAKENLNKISTNPHIHTIITETDIDNIVTRIIEHKTNQMSDAVHTLDLANRLTWFCKNYDSSLVSQETKKRAIA